jgi:hypothetical protein
MSNFEETLRAAFNHFDLNGDGTIDRDDLAQICMRLDPDVWTPPKVDALMESLDKCSLGAINYHDFVSWVTGEGDGKRVLTIYEAEIAKMPGKRLADGDKTDAGVEKVRAYFNNVLDILPTEYSLPKANSKLTWLLDIAQLLDPTRNPGGFRICQSVTLEHEALGVLLGFAQHAQHDGVVTTSLEILARTVFGNEAAASIVATHADLLPAVHTLSATAKQPTKLAMLQLVQAIVASSYEDKVVEVVPKLLSEVIPLLADKSFQVLALATFDIIVSTSFSAPTAVVELVSGEEIASWCGLGAAVGRPPWLGQDNLTLLACGLLATNLLGVSAQDLDVRKELLEGLQSSNFLELFTLAMKAAVDQREWPVNSGAYHNVKRLAGVASTLAKLGFRRQLADIVEPLTKAVETQMDDRVTALILQALRSLIEDVVCLERFLALDTFRVETLDALHQAGDEKEATELVSCARVAENALSAAQVAFEESRHHLLSPPSVSFLAGIFNNFASMDGELSFDQLLQALRRVPVGPEREINATLSSKALVTFDFGAFAQHIYGTPTFYGWWPSLMEHTNELWSHPMFAELHLPPLIELLSYFELGAKGASGLTSDTILHEVLPAWNLTTEGELVEDLFAEIRGEKPLNFNKFGLWMSRYFKAVDKQRSEAEERQREISEQHRETA